MPDPFGDVPNVPLTMGGIQVRRIDASTGSFQLGDGWNQEVVLGSQYTLNIGEGSLGEPVSAIYDTN